MDVYNILSGTLAFRIIKTNSNNVNKRDGRPNRPNSKRVTSFPKVNVFASQCDPVKKSEL